MQVLASWSAGRVLFVVRDYWHQSLSSCQSNFNLHSKQGGNAGCNMKRAITIALLLMQLLGYSEALVTSPGCSNSGSRIAIVTMATPGAYEATRYAAMINSMWAHRHGYDFYMETCVPNTQHSHTWDPEEQHRVNWAKPLVVLKHLKTHHFVLYLDADAYIVDQSMTVEEFVNVNMDDDKLLLLPKNCLGSHCWDDIPGVMGINTGAIIARHSQATFDLLEEWAGAWNTLCKEYAYTHPREQACIELIYHEGKQDVIQVFERTPLFFDVHSSWIHHEMAKDINKQDLTNRIHAHLVTLLTSNLTQSGTGWTKYAQNPVLGGEYGTVFDMHVLRNINGSYNMWFSWRPERAIAITQSDDGLSWTPPAVVLPSGSAWEDDINRPCLLHLQGMYHMWFTGQSQGKTSSIGYATSHDGYTWKRMADPVLVPTQAWEGPAVMNPMVLYDANAKVYRMWYSAGEQYEPISIGFASSKDGINWNRFSEPVFTASKEAGKWDEARVSVGQVVYASGWYYLFYMGYSNVDHSAIGIARSKNGTKDWQKHPLNPIVEPTKGTWDQDAVYKPAALFDGVEWKLWYNGRSEHVEQIGVATYAGHDLWQE